MNNIIQDEKYIIAENKFIELIKNLNIIKIIPNIEVIQYNNSDGDWIIE